MMKEIITLLLKIGFGVIAGTIATVTANNNPRIMFGIVVGFIFVLMLDNAMLDNKVNRMERTLKSGQHVTVAFDSIIGYAEKRGFIRKKV